MKKIILSVLLLLSVSISKAQFPGTDSLRNFNNRFITNEAMRAFTNLRLHNLLSGIIDFLDSANGGGSVSLGIDTLWVTADSIFHYRKNGVFRQFVIRGQQGAGSIYEVPFSNGAGRFANDSNFLFDQSQGANNSRLIVGPTVINDGGLSKINATSDNMNAAAFTSFGTGTNTIIFRRSLGSVGLPLAITEGTDLWNFSGRGYTGSFYTTSRANIYSRTTQDWTDTTHGTKLVFSTTDNDSSTMKDRVTIDHDGAVYLHNYPNLPTVSDTTYAKPTVIDSSGKLIKFDHWPGGGGTPSGSAGGDLTGTYPNPDVAGNAITNAKFRQSIGNSVIGRAPNSTGNIADIQASTSSTYFTFDGSVLKWDSIDYTHLKNKPNLQNPGVYFGPAQSFDPTFVVFASAIVYPTNSFSHGVDISWGVLDHTSGHNSSFYDTAYGSPSTGRLTLGYPNVKAVLNSKLLPDETLSGQLLILGPTVGFSTLEAPVYQGRSIGIRLTGDGSGNWTKSANYGESAAWDVTTFNTGDGGTSFNVGSPIIAVGYDELNIQYIGPNGYSVKRVYSGLGSYNVRFILQDAFSNPVTSNPTTSDEIIITNGGMQARFINMRTYQAGNNDFFVSGSNWWVDGSFECWLVAAPTSTTSTLVRWQTTYPSATNYKIYRSTTKYGARTLIHTGTDGSFTDSGLSSGTLYFYHLVAVIGGVDTYITYFTTNTQ